MPGRLLARPNRFVGHVRLADGAEIVAHISDRGRLQDILYPGAEVYVTPAEGVTRRTAYTLVCARCPPLPGRGAPPLCCLDPAIANRLVAALLAARVLPDLPAHDQVRPEVKQGASRFDFALLRGGQRQMLLEVKNMAAAAGRAALFPDAPSERAARHARELAALSRDGEATALVLCAQRADIDEIRPHPVDPNFAAALAEAAQAGVRLYGVAFEVTLEGFRYDGPRPVIPFVDVGAG